MILFICRGEIRMCHNLRRNEIDSESTKLKEVNSQEIRLYLTDYNG